jgi:hypothetical protein
MSCLELTGSTLDEFLPATVFFYAHRPNPCWSAREIVQEHWLGDVLALEDAAPCFGDHYAGDLPLDVPVEFPGAVMCSRGWLTVSVYRRGVRHSGSCTWAGRLLEQP